MGEKKKAALTRWLICRISLYPRKRMKIIKLAANRERGLRVKGRRQVWNNSYTEKGDALEIFHEDQKDGTEEGPYMGTP